jgi:hypothetical protein
MEGIATNFFQLFKPSAAAPASHTPLTSQTTIQSRSSPTISSEGKLLNFLSGGARFDVSRASITISIRLPTDLKSPEDSLDSEAIWLDLVLKSIARDPEDYKRLKDSFQKSLKAARELMASSRQGTSSPPLMNGRSADIQSQAVTYQISMQVSHVEAQVEIQNVQISTADPLVLDMKGDGIELTSAGGGAIFDINGDGQKESTAWVKGSSAFLAMDRNDNGRIDDGGELFGDQHGAADGFQELARFDFNGDTVIDRKDPVFKTLKVYQDLNGNGSIDTGEVASIEKVGIASINLDFEKSDINKNGNGLVLRGSFTTEDGTRRDIMDALLGYRSQP